VTPSPSSCPFKNSSEVASHSGFHLHSPDESQAKHLVMHIWPFVCHCWRNVCLCPLSILNQVICFSASEL
jgi:hypothetical protein